MPTAVLFAYCMPSMWHHIKELWDIAKNDRDLAHSNAFRGMISAAATNIYWLVCSTFF